MISHKIFKTNGSSNRYLSDFIIRTEQFCRVYAFKYDPSLIGDDKLEDESKPWSFPDNLYIRSFEVAKSEQDIVYLTHFDLVDNSIVFYKEHGAGITIWLEVATTADEFGNSLTQPSEDGARREYWNSKAEAMTSESHATEPYGVYVKEWYSNGDGTFSYTSTIKYSSLHHSIEANQIGDGIVQVDGITTQGQIVLDISPYTTENIVLYFNGSLLTYGIEYTAVDSIITLRKEANEGDEYTIMTRVIEEDLVVPSVNNLESVDNILGMLQLDYNNINTAIVRDPIQGGIFNYIPENAEINDGGIIFDGWTRQVEQEVLVSWFGIIPDTTTDHSQEIQAALTYCIENNKDLIIDGAYNVKEQIFTESVDRVKIQGINNAKITALAGFPNKAMVYLRGSSITPPDKWREVYIDGIIFDGENIPNSLPGEANDIVSISGSDTYRVDKATITNCFFRAGVSFETAGSDTCLMIGGVDHVIIKDNLFTGAPDSGVYISGSGTLNGTIYTLEHGRNCIITGNKFRLCGVGLIVKREFEKTNILGNFIDHCPTGIAQGRGDAYQQSGTEVIISNNNIDKCTISIIVRQQNGAVVSGNLITNMGYLLSGSTFSGSIYGIQVQGSTATIISSNSFRGYNTNIDLADVVDFSCLFLEKRVEDELTWECTYNNINGNTSSSVDIFALGVSNEVETNNNRFTGNSIGKKVDGTDMINPFINLSSTNTYHNMYSNGDIVADTSGSYLLNGSPIGTSSNGISMMITQPNPVVIDGTTEVFFTSINYTVKRDSRKILIEAYIKGRITTHDLSQHRLYVDSVKIGGGTYSDSSADNSELSYIATIAGVTTTVYNTGDIINIQSSCQLTVGTGDIIGDDIKYKITEID